MRVLARPSITMAWNFLRYHRLMRVGAQAWCGLVQQYGQFDRGETWLDRISKSDIDEHSHPRAVHVRRRFDPQPSIFRFVANAIDGNSVDVEERNCVSDLHGADFTKGGDDLVGIGTPDPSSRDRQSGDTDHSPSMR